MSVVKDHWFRADHTDEPCKLNGCGRLQGEHVESVGEWMSPRHFFRPGLRQLFQCSRCNHRWAHSTHHGSRKNRSLWIRPRLYENFHRLKDTLMRSPRCRHFSHRLKLPCLRPLVSTCSGLCEAHYDDCRDGCP